ncbi:MAG: lipoyl synthase [Candidatus Omnitrophica bacterium CG11_big_fil_rev_8_21_14_0_20_45_26]|uniref:Lipoyl synthase n=1 Tax=Candidatus Abzuiibacterium crystallinum TaxID=1974748 RepID=A0A2H0LRY5_9BACT|nr:MAG: lipoyl synthase [Candidatus Omnitrophica bacterium CG11_big_fil_rev_8_21_14_0_20_45_26]PIW64820.1 MAG: lipoyl synthase [Candidatus Omnitrophica bacterium CG12_big_fil_rev_8_21_14_0_65_45_16]
MKRFPDWLRKSRLPGAVTHTSRSIDRHQLHTVCESAKCPNRLECWNRQTATFMILGDVCTRRCGFCEIAVGRPLEVSSEEPWRVAQSAKELGLKHVVVTSVARDDLSDGGAGHFSQTIQAIRSLLPQATIEVLTPDFKGREAFIQMVCDANPDIYNHNIETVERLTPLVRSANAKYRQSLGVLKFVKETAPHIKTKSGLMLGLGETEDEVLQTLNDLREVACDILTIGQYLQPSIGKISVQEFIHPDVFKDYERKALHLGFQEAFCGPFVRSSYHADEVSAKVLQKVAASS